jgi:hypothetical protein
MRRGTTCMTVSRRYVYAAVAVGVGERKNLWMEAE